MRIFTSKTFAHIWTYAARQLNWDGIGFIITVPAKKSTPIRQKSFYMKNVSMYMAWYFHHRHRMTKSLQFSRKQLSGYALGNF